MCGANRQVTRSSHLCEKRSWIKPAAARPAARSPPPVAASTHPPTPSHHHPTIPANASSPQIPICVIFERMRGPGNNFRSFRVKKHGISVSRHCRGGSRARLLRRIHVGRGVGCGGRAVGHRSKATPEPVACKLFFCKCRRPKTYHGSSLGGPAPRDTRFCAPGAICIHAADRASGLP